MADTSTTEGTIRIEGVGLEEYLAWPESNRPMEWVDGVVEVSPTPVPLHQLVGRNLAVIIGLTVPAPWVLIDRPLDWRFAYGDGRRVRQPDLLVVHEDDLETYPVAVAPLLVVEIVSAGAAETDRVTKRAEYAAAGARHYWIVTPTDPSVVVLRLAGDAYDEVGSWSGDDEVVVDGPWPIRFHPSDLRRLR